ncbi:hypothetical protein PYK79_40895 [Streptomyces sp. ID05-04B]|uniref:hypothetical protein n=1 Tax=Streptomyces sp. ID05-04B TaxID=3028661 RepID=UPI0029C4B8BD|nr:hypothetical protein [Streptomyces sp. ID05-04B]MDX5568406.1 hypothetical protein [Streptomyces sp. ID05-04B]
MPADEVSTGSDVDAARVRSTGPRHAAPKKPLFTRFHMPAGKAIALAAMPTAVLMGMGFTPTLANAEDQPASKSLTIDEYKDCVAALEGADASASASPSPSASASESADDSKDDAKGESEDDAKDGSSSGSKDDSGDSKGTAGDSGKGGSASSDSGSDDAAKPSPAPSSAPEKSATSADTTTTTPTDTETDKNVLETIGDAITGLFDGKDPDTTTEASPSPSASAPAGDSASGSGSSDASGSGSSGKDSSSGRTSSGKTSSGTSKDTADDVTDKAKDTAEDTADKAGKTAKDAKDTAADATASPGASKDATTDAEDCPAATDDEGGIDNGKVALPDDPWYLNASSLLLKGADYQGVVKVKTANGTVKEVLKYVISGGTDIGDLHQTVKDKQSGRTYHVQAGKGTTSTIRDGDTIMYTESISGNLFGLIPVTFSPKSPPPLNIPLIYFTNAKVQQAGQFGGTLTVPGLHQFTTAG